MPEPSSFWYSSGRGVCPMHITSPYFVVSVIVVVFALSIWWATSSKEDGAHDDHQGHAH